MGNSALTNSPADLPSQAIDEQVEAQLIRILYDGQHKALAAISINAAIITIAQWRAIDHMILLVWLSCILSVILFRSLNVHAYFRSENVTENNAHWRKQAIIGAILSGIVWAAAAFFLVPITNLSHQAIVFVTLIGTAAGAVVTMASIPPAANGFIVLVIPTLVVRLLTLGNAPSFALGMMTIPFYFIMRGGSSRLYTTLVETMQMRREQEKAQEIITHQAYHDDLTGMPNRRLLLDRLRIETARARRNSCIGAVLFIDLDRFKTINDSLGHSIGDKLLQQIAQRLRDNLREEDTAARLGGDEFILLLSDLGQNEKTAAHNAAVIAEHLHAALSQAFKVESHELHITGSIGIALFPTNAQHPDDLLKHADAAMYQAKASGRNSTHFFLESIQEAADRRLLIEKELRQVLDKGGLSLHYQPFKNSDGEIVGAEGLLRWQHPEQGYISPATFIPIAEDCGLIYEIGRFVVDKACNDLATLRSTLPPSSEFFFSINISPNEFSAPDFPGALISTAKNYEIGKGLIQIELTESTLLTDIGVARDKMQRLREAGFRLAIDDFGTGHSSLAYIKHLPIDVIKLDRALIQDIATDKVGAIITETTIAMARKLELISIVEGIEEVETLDIVRGFGCDLAQGYYLGRPMAFEKLRTLLSEPDKQPEGAKPQQHIAG